MSSDAEQRFAAEKLLKRMNAWFPNVPTASIEQVRKWRNAGKLILVDVRDDEEVKVSTIVGSLRPEQVGERLEQIRNNTPQVEVVCFCTVGFRSGVHARQLCNKQQQHAPSSLLRVHNYSILSHLWSGGSLTSPRVHVYTERTGTLFPRHYEQESYSVLGACWRSLRWLGQTCIT